jgi:hypothetical protein
MSLAVTIPLFPLNTVLFPGAPLPLRVFEPRYRAMLTDVLGDDVAEGPGGPPPGRGGPLPSFGIARIRSGLEVGGVADTHPIGCLCAIEWVRRNDDGTTDLLVRGTRRFRIERRLPDDPYPAAEVAFLDESAGERAEDALSFARASLDRYADAVARLLRTEAEPVVLPDDPVAASYAAAASLSVEPNIHQMLLEARDATDRLIRAGQIARAEAALLAAIGPPARRPAIDAASLN